LNYFGGYLAPQAVDIHAVFDESQECTYTKAKPNLIRFDVYENLQFQGGRGGG
jgi:hypothetical protein